MKIFFYGLLIAFFLQISAAHCQTACIPNEGEICASPNYVDTYQDLVSLKKRISKIEHSKQYKELIGLQDQVNGLTMRLSRFTPKDHFYDPAAHKFVAVPQPAKPEVVPPTPAEKK